MNKKFILLLAFLAAVASCREADEIVIENDPADINILKKKTDDKNSNTAISKDSIVAAASDEEEDPPIKHGGHWRK